MILTDQHCLTFKTRLGFIRAVSEKGFLIRLDWDQTPFADPDRPDDVSRETISQLEAYLAGQLHHFDLPLLPEGKSETGHFWLKRMAEIPYGSTVTYAEFAKLAGRPKAARAAGSACSRNPIPIIFPCHRVVRADRSLGNYGGGSTLPPTHQGNLDRKAYLIALETQNS